MADEKAPLPATGVFKFDYVQTRAVLDRLNRARDQSHKLVAERRAAAVTRELWKTSDGEIVIPRFGRANFAEQDRDCGRFSNVGHAKTYKEPSKVNADKGEVIVDGPDGVAVTLTPEAALETSQRLLDSGLEAVGQKHALKRS